MAPGARGGGIPRRRECPGRCGGERPRRVSPRGAGLDVSMVSLECAWALGPGSSPGAACGAARVMCMTAAGAFVCSLASCLSARRAALFGSACAGRRVPPVVHPRVRAAAFRVGFLPATSRASSPRVRSRLSIIPALAGHTAARVSPRSLGTGHPRARGAVPARARSRSADGGSSPHARGRRPCPLQRRRIDRFIPAWAGHPPRAPRRADPTAAHPRAAGNGRDLPREFTCGPG